MTIGIDASRLTHEHSTGVEHYSWQIIKGILTELELSGAGEKNKVILYSRERLSEAVLNWNKNCVNEVIPRKRFWTILGLAGVMRRKKHQTLFVPSHTLPPLLPDRSVITIHDVAFRYLRKAYSFTQYHYLNFSAKFAVKRATKIIVPSEATKKDLIGFYNCEAEKVVVVPHGFAEPVTPVNEEMMLNELPLFKHFEITKNTKYILFVGRLESKKNLIRLVEAFKDFAEENPDYILILAGKRGYGFQKILNTIKRAGLMDKVVMPGYITDEEKFLLYKYSQFLAFPSLYEGFGFPVLEAFYHGKNVLCSSVSSLPEVGGEAVEYCDPYDVNSIRAGLFALAKNDAHCQELAKLAKIQLGKFKWELAAKQTLKVLYGQQ